MSGKTTVLPPAPAGRLDESRRALLEAQKLSFHVRNVTAKDLDACSRIQRLLTAMPGLTHAEMVDVTGLCHQTVSSMCTIMVLGKVLYVEGTKANNKTGHPNNKFYPTGEPVTAEMAAEARKKMNLSVPSTPELRACLIQTANRLNKGKSKEQRIRFQQIASDVLHGWMDGTLISEVEFEQRVREEVARRMAEPARVVTRETAH